MKTLVETLEYTKQHLLTQNQRAKGSGGFCRLRTETGLTCAVGCHIPKDIYEYDMEMNDFEGLFEEFPQVRPFLQVLKTPLNDTWPPYATLHIKSNFGMAIQHVHDQIPVHLWGEKMDELIAAAKELENRAAK